MMKISISRDMFAVVDDEDYPLVSRYTWSAVPNNKSGDIFYARTSGGTPARRSVWMHNLIMGCEPPHRVDHRDGDGLNNQRSNLRKCTRSLNIANSPLRRNHSKTGFRGVYFKKGAYQAQIRVNTRLISLGYFDEAVEAAKAYDAAARKYFGDFASLNFPDELLQRSAAA